MKTIELVLPNVTGLHARPAKVLVNLAKQFNSEITVLYGQKKANAKSIVSILKLGVVGSSQIGLQVNGADEDQALGDLENAIRAGLGDLEPAVEKPAGTTAKPVPASPAPTAADPAVIKGVPAAPGIAVGPVFRWQIAGPDLNDPAVLAAEKGVTLPAALAEARRQLSALSGQMAARKLTAEAAIFDAHAELLDDPDLARAVAARQAAGQTAAQAWKGSVDEQAAAIAALADPLLAARANDLQDVGRRVLGLLLGDGASAVRLPDRPSVVLAQSLTPSDTAAFDPALVLGFGIVTGGPTAHVAILARALGLPAVVGAEERLLNLAEGTPVILNGDDGCLTVNPDSAALEGAAQRQRRWLEQRRAAQEQAALPATLAEGRRVDVTANAGSLSDAAEALKMGADGIGLLRTEFLFLDRASAPGEESQFEVYSGIARTMAGRPVIIRTLDIGGDKPLPYIQLKHEMNPFLGERGIRLCLNRPALFRDQLRAILRAARSGSLRIMFPMVGDLDELRETRALLEQVRAELDAPPVPIGIMVEVPSAALLADLFAPEIDFFSIGTNDLTQYTLAVDRAHPALAAKHDGLHPAVLRLIAQTIEAAHRFGKRADLCGELGSDPLAVPILVGLGIDELSVSIPAVPTVKALVRSLKLADAQSLAQQALSCATARDVRALVKSRLAAAD